jgi:hypothetical protein
MVIVVALLAILISFGLVYLIIRITMRESFAERPYMHKPHFYKRLRHITGHPYIEPDTIIDFNIKDNCIVLTHFKSEEFIEEINANNIIKLEILNDKQITENVTIPRMILLGVFAFAEKKKTTTNSFYMYLSYKINDVVIDCVFQNHYSEQNLYDLPGKITKLKLDTTKTTLHNIK